MVAAGATVLMATSEESSSNGTENTGVQYDSQSASSQCNEIQCKRQNTDCLAKKNVSPCTSEIKRNRSHVLDKTKRLSSRLETKDSSKNVMLHKTAPIRETKTSRLRAASITSPSGGTALPRKVAGTENSSPWNLQPSTSLSTKEESPISSDNSTTMNPTRERDKSYKRKSYLNRSHNTQSIERPNQSEYSERRSRRQSSKLSHISERISSVDTGAHQVQPNLQRKHVEPQLPSTKTNTSRTRDRTKAYTASSNASATNSKSPNTRKSGDGQSDSEVSRRVDALTALTKATIERVERLASHTARAESSHAERSTTNLPRDASKENSNDNSENCSTTAHGTPSSPNKCSILKKSNDEYIQENTIRHQHAPVSILKHKAFDNETGHGPINSSHTPLPVTFSPSVVERVHKRRGILKKRSSLDESEILRRRSCSPDVSFADSSYSEFRPILKNQRRSSLDDIMKRDQSPDPQPTSILKRKSSREDDREDRQIASPEPQGILKRKSVTSTRVSNSLHHVTIATDIGVTGGLDLLENSEVRPILKKKQSREETAGNDYPPVEPRPILKKKSSTESDDHDDKPKKTILKCSRKSSQEDCDYETELTSPKKLSMLRSRALQCKSSGLFENDSVRPILKQGAPRDLESRIRLNARENTAFDSYMFVDSEDLCLRKRAQSVGHIQPPNELVNVLSKRASFESTSTSDIQQEKSQSTLFNAYNSHCELPHCNEIVGIATIDTTFNGATAEEQCLLSKNSNSDKGMKHSAQMTDSKKIDSKSTIDKQQEQSNICDTQEKYVVHRSNSVSQMALHFKILQEKAQAVDKESLQSRVQRKGSYGIQRYRERKVQGTDRFNTQPVTFQEVQEAVLQNQRSVSNKQVEVQSEIENCTTDDEFDPSKLSLAERVRLFNQKIATQHTCVSNESPHDRHSRRRPGMRYRTQPITSEEVEVASRISPLNSIGQLPSLIGMSRESEEQINSQSPLCCQSDFPKSILKPISDTHKVPRARSPELEGLKLIKSVLKKESEEQEIQASENCDIFPRSILKSTLLEKSQESNLTHDNPVIAAGCPTSQKEDIMNDMQYEQKKNAIDIIDTIHHDVYCAYDDNKKKNTESMQHETKQRYAVPFHKSIISQDQLCKTRTNTTLDNVDNVTQTSENTIYLKHSKEEKSLPSEKTTQLLDDEALCLNHQDITKVAKNEATHRRYQMSTKQKRSTALSKSTSHHALSNESGSIQQQHAIALPGLCRSATQTISVVDESESPSMTIADRLAALQRSGNTNWKRRVVTESHSLSESTSGSIFNKEDLTIKQGVLADCLGKLETATEGWKKRIAAPDALNFTVAGKMKVDQTEDLQADVSSPLIEVVGNIVDRKKKTARPARFRGRKADIKDAFSTPSSPCKESSVAIHGSFSEPVSDDSGEENKKHSAVSTVIVPKIDDESFTSFFTDISLEKCEAECLDVDENVFDVITSHSELLVQKRNIQTQRRRMASRNPLKVLAARTDLRSEYTEIRTGVAERVMKTLNVEKLAKTSSLAVEALAGLASTEDFSNITLRSATETDVPTNKLRPYKDHMLILIKGRRHVQVRLVEPVVESINSGDNFVLVTKSEIYNYVGKFSNVIEKARGAEIALSIQQNKDLGCQASQVITINDDKLTCTKTQLQNFWNYLGANNDAVNVLDAGHPDEDELYESAIIDTNMVYEIKGEELVPFEKYWGAIPKIEMLDPNKILLFDFGSEMYIWSGKAAPSNEKKIATHLATEMWNEGYDYTECSLCPITAASVIGRRSKSLKAVQNGKERPKWCVLAKLTQHVETVLFREKFLDWPNVSGIIRVKGVKPSEQVDGTITVEPCDVNDMIKPNTTAVDLMLEGSHLGRGTGWYDAELMKQYIVTTSSVMVWHIDEFSHSLLNEPSIGQFYAGDSYIVRWMYSVTITGRELSGLPSKHSAKGRDRSAYFIWQGQSASLNEQGAAALLTIELDHDQGPQIRVVQGYEPPAFLNLFSGRMVIHQGKKTDKKLDERWRLYICRGTLEAETVLIEIPCSARQLRSRGALILIDTQNLKIYVWYGSNSLPHIQKIALNAANKIVKYRPEEIGLGHDGNIEVCEIEERNEPNEFFEAFGGINRKLYISLENKQIQDDTPRLFHLSSVSKEFLPTELLCPHRSDLPIPFPFLQDELYQVNQPAIFLLDNQKEIWIWQGWWPDTGTEDQSGSKTVRYQAERRAAMTLAVQYWQTTHPESTQFPIYLVWAGLEPLQFINLFPIWTYRDDIAKLNIEDGRDPGEVLTAESELARLTQSTYPPAQLLQRPLPEGVDPTRLELYLSQQHFQELLGMSKEDFQELPAWKQLNLKKEIGLF